MFSHEMFATNLTFQGGGGRFDHLFPPHAEILTKRPLFEGSLTNASGFNLFFFALEAILKVDLESYNHGNGSKTARGQPCGL